MNEKNLTPSESDQQWLKKLFDSASEEQQPQEQILTPHTEEDAQWLKELFSSAELAAEQEFAPEEPEEPPLIESIDLPQWPEDTVVPAVPAPATATIQNGIPMEMPVLEPQPEPEITVPAVSEPESPVQAVDLVLPEEPVEEEAPVLDAYVSQPPQAMEPLFPEEQAVVEAEDLIEDSDDNEEEEDEAFIDHRAPSKRRPKNSGAYGLFGIPHLMVTAVWLVIILTFGVFLGQWLWKGASDVLAFGREEKKVTITITASDDLDSLIDKLHTAGLINEPMWFRWYGQLTDVMEDVAPGTFELSTLYDYRALVTHMGAYSAARVTVKVIIPEGYTCAQTFALLESKGVCTAEDLEAAAMHGDLNDYWFLDGITRDQKYCLEGYLFPDTYEFYVGDQPSRVLNKLLSNFDARFTDIMEGKLEVLNQTLAEMMRKNGLPESYIEANLFTIREVVIIASMIEKETSGVSEGYTISSVIYNRLTNPTNFPYLNIDAALVYVTGSNTITEADKQLDSPYNTYLYPGLIPGPICNPSRVSLDAALDPSATDFYFYALNPATNEHHFSKTLKEHQAFLDSLPKEEPTEP